MPRIRVLGVLVVVLLATTATPASGQALPDVESSAPFDVRVVQRDGRSYLGFSTEARNRGAGALRIRGTGDGSQVMAASQLSEDGSQVLNPNVGTLRYVSTLTHQHWHYMDFMRYELLGVDHPSVLRDQKQGFCLGDAPFVTGWCARDAPALTTTDLGLRPGGHEIYTGNVEGQEILIDPAAAPAGRYVLTARIGPTGVLRETRTDNNVSSTVIQLTWPPGAPPTRPIRSIDSCVGRGCTKSLPARNAAVARALARKALRRTLGRRNAAGARVRCRVFRERVHACRVRVRHGPLSFRGSVRVWYLIGASATRWYYTVKVVRRARGCGDPCTRRIRRARRLGGKVAAATATATGRASATSLLCRPAR
jgi:Lysyl oxidase